MDQKVNQTTLRVFLGLPFFVFEREAGKLIRKLSDAYPKIRWVSPTQIHVTLHFFGGIHPDDVTRITQCVLPITERVSPFEVRLEGLGAFPNLNRPKVVWLGVSGADQALRDFQQRVEISLHAAGFPTEVREFKPHLSLGRVKENVSCAGLARVPFKPTPMRKIHEVILFKSLLTSKGPIYDALKTYPLAAA